MTQAVTDFIAPPGYLLGGITVSVKTASKFQIIHIPTGSLGLNGGNGSVGHKDNRGGRFGWISFGVGADPTYVLYPPQPISYLAQKFIAPVDGCTVVRIWLEPGVKVDTVCDFVGDITVILKKMVPLLTAIAARIAAAVVLAG